MLDEVCNLRWAVMPGIHIAVRSEDAFDLAVIEAHEHDSLVASLQEDFANRSKLDAAPFLTPIVASDENNDQLRAVTIDVLQQNIQRRTCKLGLVIVVIVYDLARAFLLTPQRSFYQWPRLARE